MRRNQVNHDQIFCLHAENCDKKLEEESMFVAQDFDPAVQCINYQTYFLNLI